MNIKIEDIIGLYLATTTNDNQTISEVECEIIKICEKIKEKAKFLIPSIEVSDVAKFAYMNYSFIELKNDKNGYLRIIVTDSENKRDKMIKMFSANLPLEIQEYFVNPEPTFVKKNN